MIEKVSAYVKKHHMLSAGDMVVAGVSGGADSVCLLFVLKELQKTIDFSLMVVHVNHGIRPEAGADAAYVKDLCSKLQIPCFVAEEKVEILARQQGISTEEAGRKVRYEAFERVLKEQASQAVRMGKAKIAVAHNSNDRAETMLFHLFRGTGISGLCSIRPVRDNIIRPLLSVSRLEIEEFLQDRGIPFCIDKTNSEDTYTRNKIRHHILPYAESEVAEGAVAHMNHTADLMQEAEDFIHSAVETAYAVCVMPPQPLPEGNCPKEGQVPQVDCEAELQLKVAEFKNLHSLIRKQLILKVVETLTSTKKDITATHVCDVMTLFEQDGNRQISLPYGISVRRQYDMVIFEKKKNCKNSHMPSPKEKCVWEIPLDFQGTIHIPGLGDLEFSTFSYEKSMDIPRNQCTKWFNCDKIDKPLVIRNRNAGDYLTINSQLSKKSLQDYMVDEKIPKGERDDIWLLTRENHVLWVIGHRISEEYKIDANTKKILQIQLRGGH
ncbi:MAG: tRNA lysidine(34) synthetase TilS [Lachnospiraceae bacterium]|nr:tRNA lysidine(34) synthetase TilS [Lachnospiraceae bacterium]